MTKARKLRELIASPRILMAPGAYDALSAKIVEEAGFDAVYMTGYGASASRLGEPDVGYLTMTEMVEQARAFAQAVDVPVLADGDTGYGNPLNVRRTVEAYERAGVAAIQLEDQVFPKRCGHMLGRRVIPAEEMVEKIRAAAEARQDSDFVIIARSDARTVLGLEEVLRRLRLYREAGADLLFAESLESVEEMQAFNRAFPDAPTFANMIESGRTPVLTAHELEAIGYAVAVYPVGTLYTAAKAVKGYLETLRREGTPMPHLDRMLPFPAFNALVGLPAYNDLERRYAVQSAESLEEKSSKVRHAGA